MSDNPQPYYTIEVYVGDGNHPPGEPGLNVNSSVVWLKVNGQWYRTPKKGAYHARNDILTILDAQKYPPEDKG